MQQNLQNTSFDCFAHLALALNFVSLKASKEAEGNQFDLEKVKIVCVIGCSSHTKKYAK